MRGDLSRVADGFRCRRCDGTIQVKSFRYLGDTTARIRNGWMKFRELLPFLTSRATPLEMKGRVYASCVRSSMIYGSEPLLVAGFWLLVSGC